MDPFKVLVPEPIANEGIERLKDAGCSVVMPDKDDHKTILESVTDCQAILVRTTGINREILESANKLKVIARHGVGLDNVDVDAASEKNVYVCNAPKSNINSVAEHVVGMMVNLSHQILKGDKAIRNGNFGARNTYIGTELKGKTLGLIGFGNIGRLVAEKCALGFGMKIVVYDPYIKLVKQDYVEWVDTMEKVIRMSDYVSLHVPYSPELYHLIDRNMLKNMKPGAFLINAARGGLVDEEALYEFLANGKVAGAGLDCFEQEPAQPEHPFWGLDNVIVTPHMAAHTKESMISMAVDAADEIISVKNNETPESCVNLNKLDIKLKT